MIALNDIASAPAERNSQRGAPMWTIRGLVSALDRNEDKVIELIECGDLAWAFDLSLIPERARRRELRVLPACVEDFLARRACSLEWPEVARLILPHDKPEICAREIQRSLNVSASHVTALIRRKLLKCVSMARPGPTGSALVTTSSFLEFIKARRYF